MSSRSWINKIFGLRSRASARGRRSRPTLGVRPTLEILEDRLAPAAFLVSSVGDLASDPTTLRHALANLDPGTAASTNTITFAPTLAGQTIALKTADGGQLAITQGVTITGLGADQLAVSGNNASRVFLVTSTTAVVQITGLTIENGLTTGSLGGGAVYNAGTLTLTADAVVNSTARGGNGGVSGGVGGGGAGLGGGVSNGGTLMLLSSTLSGNQAVGGTGDPHSYNLGLGGAPNGGAPQRRGRRLRRGRGRRLRQSRRGPRRLRRRGRRQRGRRRGRRARAASAAGPAAPAASTAAAGAGAAASAAPSSTPPVARRR